MGYGDWRKAEHCGVFRTPVWGVVLYGILYTCSLGFDFSDYRAELSFLPDFVRCLDDCFWKQQGRMCFRASDTNDCRTCELLCCKLSLIFSLGTATSVTDNYSFTLNFRIVFVLLGFAYLMILGEKTRIKIRKLHIRMVSICLSVLLMAGYVTAKQVESVEHPIGMDDILFTPKEKYLSLIHNRRSRQHKRCI